MEQNNKEKNRGHEDDAVEIEKHLEGLSEDEKKMIRLIADIFVNSLLESKPIY
jgi:hypothetical protein